MTGQLLSIADASARLGLKPGTLRSIVRSRGIPYYRVGVRRGGIRIAVEDIERYLMAGRVEIGQTSTEVPRKVSPKRYQCQHLSLAPRPSRGRPVAR
jgi:excisionase family DNA binding protein